MKTRITILALLFTAFYGRSKDDTSTEELGIPANQKFLSTITKADGITLLSLEYYGDKNVERIKYGEEGLFIYCYEENQISSLDVYFGEAPNYNFTYDAGNSPEIYRYTYIKL